MKTSDLSGGIWAFFSYQVFSDLIKGTFVLATTRIGTMILSMLMVSYAWHVLGPEKKTLDSVRRSVADAACAQALEKLPYDKSLYRVAVLPFERDYTSYITETLHRKLNETGRYNVRDKGTWEKLKKYWNFDPGEVAGKEAALKAGKHMGVDAVVFGSVPEHVQDGDKAGIVLNVSMIHIPDGNPLAEFTIKEGLSKSLVSPGYVEAQIHNASLMQRILLCLMVCLLIPVLFAFVVRQITRRDSNAYNFALLAGFAILNLVAAILIMNIPLTTVGGCLTILLVLGISSMYDFAVCTKIDDLAK